MSTDDSTLTHIKTILVYRLQRVKCVWYKHTTTAYQQALAATIFFCVQKKPGKAERCQKPSATNSFGFHLVRSASIRLIACFGRSHESYAAILALAFCKNNDGLRLTAIIHLYMICTNTCWIFRIFGHDMFFYRPRYVFYVYDFLYFWRRTYIYSALWTDFWNHCTVYLTWVDVCNKFKALILTSEGLSSLCNLNYHHRRKNFTKKVNEL